MIPHYYDQFEIYTPEIQVVTTAIDAANIVMMPGTVVRQPLVATYVSERYLDHLSHGQYRLGRRSEVQRAKEKYVFYEASKPLEGIRWRAIR